MIKSKKAVNEIISTILIMLVMVIVVGIIITGVNSQISKGKEKTNYDNSIKVRDMVFSEIMEIYNSPIEATKEINFSLSNLELTIDSDTETIEICSVGKNLSFFADGKRLEQDNNKYVYRELQKICSGVAFENIDLIRSITLSNKEQTRLVFKKITENKISVSVDNETSTSWYTQKNEYVYDENAGEWLYRKKILINSGNLVGDLNNLSVQLDLEDEDLMSYANIDASDIIFTLGDGITKIKREIVDYNSDTGALSVLIKGPQFNYGPDINNPVYDDNTYRKKITIDHTKVDGDLNDFPMLISIVDENLANLGANADGNDIYFTASDGTTRLKREIESFSKIYRKKITIDHNLVDSDLNDFPMLISIVDENLVSYGANADGNDIYFTTNDEITRLRREIEDYNSETGALVAWVKIPELSSTTDTDIYMYFGDSEENNTNDTDVWDSNFVGVWHKNDLTTTTIADSTSNSNNGTKKATLEPSEIIGKIGYAQNYDGSNDYINTGNKSAYNSQIITIELWGKLNGAGSHTDGTYLINKGRASSVPYFSYIIRHIEDTNQFNLLLGFSDNTYGSIYANEYPITDNDWHHFVGTYDGDDLNFYINGNLIQSRNYINKQIKFDFPNNELYIGAWNTPVKRAFNGNIDEVRLSNTARTTSWIKTEYNNQSAPETFSAVGELEKTAVLFARIEIPELSSTTDTEIYLNFGDSEENNLNDINYEDLSLWFNAKNRNSYPGSGNTITDLAGDTSWTFNQSLISFDNVDKSFNFPNNTTAKNIITQDNVTLESDTNSLTYYFWAKVDSPNSASYNSLLNDRTQGTTPFIWIFKGGNSLYMQNTDGVSNFINITSSNYFLNYTNQYLNIVATVKYDENASQVKYYRNGSLINTVNTNKLLLPNQNNTKKIGIYSTAGTHVWVGDIKEFRIYNDILSGEFIQTEYNNLNSPETFYSVGTNEIVENIAGYDFTKSTTDTPIYIYFGNPDANISDNSIEDSNTATISIGVLEKS
ncbi:MAG TPA: DUF2341 domain-containing protein [archaeon]|nr:DUF2341 domain-containing protein [archaeon]